MRMRRVVRQPPDDMILPPTVAFVRLGATQAQNLDLAAGGAHRVDQSAGIDELAVVTRFGVRERQP